MEMTFASMCLPLVNIYKESLTSRVLLHPQPLYIKPMLSHQECGNDYVKLIAGENKAGIFLGLIWGRISEPFAKTSQNSVYRVATQYPFQNSLTFH